ncbi:MAG: hypothetical protein OXT49_07630, partial [Gammaproteobacteria bacterium]|nr:hypothetical protein [Gammaproteobacteria bacterium]
LFDFRRQVVTVCDILDLDFESVLAALERKFIATGKTVADEMEVVREMGRAYSHAQGWPVIWFYSEFHVQISNLLYELIEDVISSRAYPQHILKALWRAIQHHDPEYLFSSENPKPKDISRLPVMKSEDWFESVESESPVLTHEVFPEDWVTAFEFRQVAHDTEHHVEYMIQSHLRSVLVSQFFLSNIDYLANTVWDEPRQVGYEKENLTWEQFREAVSNIQPADKILGRDITPFTSSKECTNGFLGFHTICTLSPWVLDEAKLRIDGFSVYSVDELVAVFEPWREGTPINDHENSYLSFGVRLRVNAVFVKEICERTGKKFVIRERAQRVLMDHYRPKPKRSSSAERFVVMNVVDEN